jgi:3-methyladenine DNA glycosylase AlkC
MKTIYDHQLYEVSESKDGNFFVKSGKNMYRVKVEYPEHLNENVRTFKCSCCKGDGLCEHARAVIEYLEGLDEADEVVLALRQATEKYVAKICRKGEQQ